VRVALASTGASSDLDLLVPRGLALFKAGGSKQFFHGGLSPQELVVPVVVADLAVPADTGSIKVDVDVVGGVISTGVFAATVSFSGNRSLPRSSPGPSRDGARTSLSRMSSVATASTPDQERSSQRAMMCASYSR